MRYSLGLIASASVVLAATHDVDVGPLMMGSESFVFVPDTLTAAMGDTINFHFYNPGGHSVAQSQFGSPCMPMQGGIWSGFMTGNMGESKMVFSVPVNSTDPMWLYCATNDHCNEGMVMAVNPTGSMTLSAYKAAAAMANGNDPPANVNEITGGTIIMEGAASMPMSTASSSSMASMMTSSMASSSSMATMMMSSMASSSSMAAMMPTSSMGSAGMMPSMTSSAAAMVTSGAASNVKAPAAAIGLAGAIGAWAMI